MTLKSGLNNADCFGWKSARPLLAVLVLLAGAAFVRAVEDDMVVEGPVTRNPQSEDAVQNIRFPEFNQLVFQNNDNPRNAEQRILARTELQMAEIDQVCQLSDAQKQKLQLAARGDLRRLFDQVDIVRMKFNKLMQAQQKNDGMAFNDVYQQMWQEIQPLQKRASMGLTDGSASLFAKILPQLLTSDQRDRYAAVTNERLRFRYEANIAVALQNLEDVVFLSEAQRDTITKLLLAMPPPRQTGQYETHVVQCRIGVLPVERIEPLFNPRQWRKFKVQIDQYRAMRQNWLQAGILTLEDVPELATQEKP